MNDIMDSDIDYRHVLITVEPAKRNRAFVVTIAETTKHPILEVTLDYAPALRCVLDAMRRAEVANMTTDMLLEADVYEMTDRMVGIATRMLDEAWHPKRGGRIGWTP